MTEREHIASPHCWCDPELLEPEVYLHHDMEESEDAHTDA